MIANGGAAIEGAGRDRVLVIVVTWNKRKDVLDLLAQVAEKVHYPGFDIVVVDNASTDGTVEALRASHPEVTLLINAENLGGTGGFNTGLRYALEHQAEYGYVWLLDNDVLLDGDPLSPAIEILASDPDIGVVGSTILSRENPEIVTEIGGTVTSTSLEFNARGTRLSDHELGEVAVDYVAACSAVVSMATLARVGLWDEAYFLYWDDVDFCTQIRRAGFEILATTRSRVIHHPDFVSSVLTGGAYYFARNSWYYFLRKVRRPRRAVLSLTIAAATELTIRWLKYDHRLVALVRHAFLDAAAGRSGKSTWPNSYLQASAPARPWGVTRPLERMPSEGAIVLPYRLARADAERVAAALHERLGPVPIYLLSSHERLGLFEQSRRVTAVAIAYRRPLAMAQALRDLLTRRHARFIYQEELTFGSYVFPFSILPGSDGGFVVASNRRAWFWARALLGAPLVLSWNLVWILFLALRTLLRRRP